MHIAKVVMKSFYINLEELAKKYGYSSHSNISEYIEIYRNREKINQFLNVTGATSTPLGRKQALKILRELKQKKEWEIGSIGI